MDSKRVTSSVEARASWLKAFLPQMVFPGPTSVILAYFELKPTFRASKPNDFQIVMDLLKCEDKFPMDEVKAYLEAEADPYGVPCTLALDPNDGLLGFVTTLGCLRSRMDIQFLYVAPDARRSGIGRLLLDQVETQARAYNYSKLIMRELQHGMGACKFFLRCNFHFYHGGYELVRRQRTLRRIRQSVASNIAPVDVVLMKIVAPIQK